jgi:hypothetical protein
MIRNSWREPATLVLRHVASAFGGVIPASHAGPALREIADRGGWEQSSLADLARKLGVVTCQPKDVIDAYRMEAPLAGLAARDLEVFGLEDL